MDIEELIEQLDEALVADLETMEVGDVSEAIDEGDGYYFYQLQDAATRPRDEEDAALVRENAFLDWYDLLYFAAEDEGRPQGGRDQSVALHDCLQIWQRNLLDASDNVA